MNQEMAEHLGALVQYSVPEQISLVTTARLLRILPNGSGCKGFFPQNYVAEEFKLKIFFCNLPRSFTQFNLLKCCMNLDSDLVMDLVTKTFLNISPYFILRSMFHFVCQQ